MDIFDDYESDEEVKEGVDPIFQEFNEIFIQLVKLKPFVVVSERSTLFSDSTQDMILNRTYLVLYSTSVSSTNRLKHVFSFIDRLKLARFETIQIININGTKAYDITTGIEFLPFESNYDVVLDLRTEEECESNVFDCDALQSFVDRGGHLICNRQTMNLIRENNPWKWMDIPMNGSMYALSRRRDVSVNESACSYWTNHSEYDLAREYQRIDDVTIVLSQKERQFGVFSDVSHRQAVENLSQHGLCVFPGLFSSKLVSLWGDAIREDMNDAYHRLKSKGIDLKDPGNGPKINNFFELSMREPFRVDLRNGRHVKSLSSLTSDSLSSNPKYEALHAQPWGIDSHPGIRRIIAETMNPVDGPDARGNWGMWNFEGPGPNVSKFDRPIKIGHIGGVVSLSGCVDQTIHADTAHLFTLVHLPGHYFNLFLPASEYDRPIDQTDLDTDRHDNERADDYELGQTAFVMRSHRLDVSAKTMVDEGGQKLLESLLVRPHLSTGDALVFDCRILHFGLANRAPWISVPSIPFRGKGRDDTGLTVKERLLNQRVMIYINHHQPWFIDPKNWNDREKLFEDES